jgi:ORF6N domain
MGSHELTTTGGSHDGPEGRIYEIRGTMVILDSDLAEFYGVGTKRLNEQVTRNKERFPDDFAFTLTSEEWENLMSQNATSSWGGRRTRPRAFSEQGALAVSAVIKSPKAAEVSVAVARAFVAMRERLTQAQEILALPTNVRALEERVKQLESQDAWTQETVSELASVVRELGSAMAILQRTRGQLPPTASS